MAHLKNSITDTSQLQQNNLIYKKMVCKKLERCWSVSIGKPKGIGLLKIAFWLFVVICPRDCFDLYEIVLIVIWRSWRIINSWPEF